MTPINNFPDDVIEDSSTGLIWWLGQNSFRDHYYMRLSETYLLRAEAYLRNGENIMAASDINTVRARAHATP